MFGQVGQGLFLAFVQMQVAPATGVKFIADQSLTVAVEGHLETVGCLLEDGVWQTVVEHQLDHAVNAVAQPFDEAHVGQNLHDDLVAREPLLDDVVQGDVAGQPAGAVEFDAVAEHEDADALAPDAVVAVGYGVDDGLAHGFDRVLCPFLALQPHQANPFAHVADQKALRPADLLGQGIADVLPQKLVAHLPPGVAHHDDLIGTEEALRLLAKEEEASVGWPIAVALFRQAAPLV